MSIRYFQRDGWYFLVVGGQLYGKYRSYMELQDIISELKR
jgi:hypothetical protein